MELIETRYEHIVLNEAGIPYIAGTTMKVIELVLAQQAYGWSAQEPHFLHAYLSLGQIYSALAYYGDHKNALDQDIAQRQQQVEELRRTIPVPPFIAKLKS